MTCFSVQIPRNTPPSTNFDMTKLINHLTFFNFCEVSRKRKLQDFSLLFQKHIYIIFISRGRVFSYISIEIRKKIGKYNKGQGAFFGSFSEARGGALGDLVDYNGFVTFS